MLFKDSYQALVHFAVSLIMRCRVLHRLSILILSTLYCSAFDRISKRREIATATVIER